LKKDMPSSKGCRLYVGNINHKVRPREVEKLFSDYGEVVDFDFKDRGQQVNFCFVEYRRSSDAELAIEKLGGRRLLSAPLIVEHARDRNEKKRGSRFDSFGPSSHVKRRFEGSSLSRSHSRGRGGHGRGHSRSRSRSHSRSPSHSHGRKHTERRSHHNEKVSGTHTKDRSSRSRSNNTRSRSRKRIHSSRHNKSGQPKGSHSRSNSRSRSNASKQQPQQPQQPQQQNGSEKANLGGHDKRVEETLTKEQDSIPNNDSVPITNPPNGNADDVVDKGHRQTNANWNEKELSKSPPTTRLASDLEDPTKETYS